MWSVINKLIVSRTKFLVVIGSLHVSLLCDQLALDHVGVQFEQFVIGYLRDLHGNYAFFNSFLHNILVTFQNLGKAL